MAFVKNSISKWITAALVLILGILCCIANGSSNLGDYENISLFLGWVFIILGSLALVLGLIVALLNKKTFASSDMISAGALLAAGIFFVADKTVAVVLIGALLNYVPYVMIVVGFVIAVDAILILVFGILKKNLKPSLILFIAEIIMAILAIVLGAIALDSKSALGENKFLIFGIMLIIYAVLIVLATFFSPTLVVVFKRDEAKKDSIDAEVVTAEDKANTETKETEENTTEE